MGPFPVTRAHVEGDAYLGVSAAGAADETALSLAADAASEWVAEHVLGLDPANPAGWPTEARSTVVLGTKMLAARWYQRRSSPNGVASFGEFGTAYVMRHDPDIARLLGLGRPVVG